MNGRKCGAEFDFTMLGEVSLYRGVWKQGYSYSLDEVVEHEGNLYRSLIDENQTDPGTQSRWFKIVVVSEEGGEANSSRETVRFDNDYLVPIGTNDGNKEYTFIQNQGSNYIFIDPAVDDAGLGRNFNYFILPETVPTEGQIEICIKVDDLIVKNGDIVILEGPYKAETNIYQYGSNTRGEDFSFLTTNISNEYTQVDSYGIYRTLCMINISSAYGDEIYEQYKDYYPLTPISPSLTIVIPEINSIPA